MKADIKLLAVTPSMPPVYVGEGFIPTDTLDAEKERFREVLEDGIRQLESQGFSCQGQLSFGEPVDEIARVAREWNANLIVMGHRRAGSWAERWWRGSLSKSLVEISPCSVRCRGGAETTVARAKAGAGVVAPLRTPNDAGFPPARGRRTDEKNYAARSSSACCSSHSASSCSMSRTR